MRVSHIELRIEEQYSIKYFFKSVVPDLLKDGKLNITRHQIEVRLNALNEKWEKFKLNHSAINIAMTKLSKHEKKQLLHRSYFDKNYFNSTESYYFEAVSKMNELLSSEQSGSSSIRSLNINTPVDSTISNFQFLSNGQLGCRLPRYEVPKFNGSLSDWLSFKDQFLSMILSNPSLSSVAKFQYLKLSLTGSASEILKNTATTADSFEKSWNFLISYYENKRVLIGAAISSLFKMEPASQESSSELERLYTTITQIHQTLESLQRPVQYYDDFFVQATIQCFDGETIKLWEQQSSLSTEPVSWDILTHFLKTRILSLKSYEKVKPNKPLNHKSVKYLKSHHSGRINNDNTNDNNSTTSKEVCPLCSSDHYIARCSQYTDKTSKQRWEIVKKYNLCFNCLKTHKSSSCWSVRRCNKCGKKHHSSLHEQEANITSKNNYSYSKKSSLTEAKVNNVVYYQSSTILLATAKIWISSQHGERISARALIDQGSEISLITERIVQQLHLPRKNSSIAIIGIGGKNTNKAKGIVSFEIQPHFDSSEKLTISAYVLSKLTSTIPSTKMNNCSWPHLQGLQFADPNFNIPGQIDIVLGADIYSHIIEDGVVKGIKNSPIAQLTKLGWIISGPSDSITVHNVHQGYHAQLEVDLHNSLKRFWQLDEVPSPISTSSLSKEEQDCEDHYKNTHSRDKSGRYIVKLPFKSSINQLGDSYFIAKRTLNRLCNKFDANPSYYQIYSEFINEYEKLHHMKLASTTSTHSKSYYLPHHGVFRDSSLTTKLRVVFNGSSRTTTGISINDILHSGAKLQTDLFDVLIWFRQFHYVFSADMEKMYRQISVHPDDWNLQKILWITNAKEIIEYQLTTVTYGLACAPFLALRTVKQLIDDEGSKFPLAIPPLTKGRYVDDVFGGADTIEQAQQQIQQITKLCMAGGFSLQKWISNCAEIVNSTPVDKKLSSLLKDSDEITVHTLGLNWKPSLDTFHFMVNTSTSTPITKRKILSTIAKIFDPLGFLSPITIKAKIFIQELWSIKVDWDDNLPLQIEEKWITFLHQIQELSTLTFPRWLGLTSQASIQLHGFCDASQLAMSAVIYIRSSQNQEITTTLTCAKTKVAPLKRQTIPRLELSGAVLLTKLVHHVIKVLKLVDSPIYLWTDSSITYTWINNHPSRWKEFVHNRVCFIQETLPQAKWKFISGKENPADLATRGLNPIQLSSQQLWWTGPDWLRQPDSSWPNGLISLSVKENLEERTVQATTITQSRTPQLWNLIEKYSSLSKLLRITAICQQSIKPLKSAIFHGKIMKQSSLATISPEHLEKAKNYWIYVTQSYYFHSEIKSLKSGQLLPKSNSLIKLTPYIDSNGIMRVGGRLQAAQLDANFKHPIILPKNSTLSKLIIAEAHSRTLHGGTQVTLSYIRNEYWIVGGRAPVRSFILKCITCTRYRQQRAQQLMGQLPSSRVTPSRAFLHSGVDCAGPFIIKTWKGKAAKTYKAYIVLFICFSTSAIHLELVTDYSTDAFLAAYRRFTSRRGICATLTSDCGTNFKGADSELQKLFSFATEESKQIAILMTNDGTKWNFNPPSAPHFGGKWESGVKSVKHHLRRVVGDQLLTFEEMTTLLTQIEAVLNSRPLNALTDDPDDLNCLTPGHFLIGQAPIIIPEPSLQHLKLNRLSRWQLIRQMLESFWKKWSSSFLQRYHTTYKWNQQITPIQKGTLVLVVDERYPPSKWPLGRITEVHPGPDGHIRVVTVRTQTSTFRRPIVKLCPLPIKSDDSLI